MCSLVVVLCCSSFLLFFFFNDTATTEIYTLSLHDALPISAKMPGTVVSRLSGGSPPRQRSDGTSRPVRTKPRPDRKSTRLNSSHSSISYAVFCLKKKKKKTKKKHNHQNKNNIQTTPLLRT